MAAMGQSRRFRDVRDMSLVPLITAMVLHCRERRDVPEAAVSQVLLNHLVGDQQEVTRDRNPERIRGLKNDDQLELARLHHRQVAKTASISRSVLAFTTMSYRRYSCRRRAQECRRHRRR